MSKIMMMVFLIFRFAFLLWMFDLNDFMLSTLTAYFMNSGSSNVKKVDILWKDCPYASRARQGNGELYLRVFMSANCNRKEFWRLVKNDCLRIMDMIDWEKSHPDDIHDITLANGIDVAWECFLSVSFVHLISPSLALRFIRIIIFLFWMGKLKEKLWACFLTTLVLGVDYCLWPDVAAVGPGWL